MLALICFILTQFHSKYMFPYGVGRVKIQYICTSLKLPKLCIGNVCPTQVLWAINLCSLKTYQGMLIRLRLEKLRRVVCAVK